MTATIAVKGSTADYLRGETRSFSQTDDLVVYFTFKGTSDHGYVHDLDDILQWYTTPAVLVKTNRNGFEHQEQFIIKIRQSVGPFVLFQVVRVTDSFRGGIEVMNYHSGAKPMYLCSMPDFDETKDGPKVGIVRFVVYKDAMDELMSVVNSTIDSKNFTVQSVQRFAELLKNSKIIGGNQITAGHGGFGAETSLVASFVYLRILVQQRKMTKTVSSVKELIENRLKHDSTVDRARTSIWHALTCSSFGISTYDAGVSTPTYTSVGGGLSGCIDSRSNSKPGFLAGLLSKWFNRMEADPNIDLTMEPITPDMLVIYQTCSQDKFNPRAITTEDTGSYKITTYRHDGTLVNVDAESCTFCQYPGIGPNQCVISVAGDGNCLFNALDFAGYGACGGGEALRRRLIHEYDNIITVINADLRYSQTQLDAMRKSIGAVGQPVAAEVVAFVARWLDVNICMHTDDKIIRHESCLSTDMVHLYFKYNHVDLIAERGAFGDVTSHRLNIGEHRFSNWVDVLPVPNIKETDHAIYTHMGADWARSFGYDCKISVEWRDIFECIDFPATRVYEILTFGPAIEQAAVEAGIQYVPIHVDDSYVADRLPAADRYSLIDSEFASGYKDLASWERLGTTLLRTIPGEKHFVYNPYSHRRYHGHRDSYFIYGPTKNDYRRQFHVLQGFVRLCTSMAAGGHRSAFTTYFDSDPDIIEAVRVLAAMGANIKYYTPELLTDASPRVWYTISFDPKFILPSVLSTLFTDKDCVIRTSDVKEARRLIARAASSPSSISSHEFFDCFEGGDCPPPDADMTTSSETSSDSTDVNYTHIASAVSGFDQHFAKHVIKLNARARAHRGVMQTIITLAAKINKLREENTSQQAKQRSQLQRNRLKVQTDDKITLLKHALTRAIGRLPSDYKYVRQRQITIGGDTPTELIPLVNLGETAPDEDIIITPRNPTAFKIRRAVEAVTDSVMDVIHSFTPTYDALSVTDVATLMQSQPREQSFETTFRVLFHEYAKTLVAGQEGADDFERVWALKIVNLVDMAKAQLGTYRMTVIDKMMMCGDFMHAISDTYESELAIRLRTLSGLRRMMRRCGFKHQLKLHLDALRHIVSRNKTQMRIPNTLISGTDVFLFGQNQYITSDSKLRALRFSNNNIMTQIEIPIARLQPADFREAFMSNVMDTTQQYVAKPCDGRAARFEYTSEMLDRMTARLPLDNPTPSTIADTSDTASVVSTTSTIRAVGKSIARTLSGIASGTKPVSPTNTQTIIEHPLARGVGVVSEQEYTVVVEREHEAPITSDRLDARSYCSGNSAARVDAISETTRITTIATSDKNVRIILGENSMLELSVREFVEKSEVDEKNVMKRCHEFVTRVEAKGATFLPEFEGYRLHRRTPGGALPDVNDTILYSFEEGKLGTITSFTKKTNRFVSSPESEYLQTDSIKWMAGKGKRDFSIHYMSIVAVPGAGKTRLATTTFDHTRDYYIVNTREGREETVEKIVKHIESQHQGSSSTVFNADKIRHAVRQRVRTPIGMMVAMRKERKHALASRVFFDEVYNYCAGAVFIIIRYFRPSLAVFIGDPEQIKMINSGVTPCVLQDMDRMVPSTIFINASLRTPAITSAVLTPEYERYMHNAVFPGAKVYSANERLGSMALERIPTVSAVTGHTIVTPTTVALSAYHLDVAQAEKHFNKALTIHQSQGLTYRDVAIVRTVNKKGPPLYVRPSGAAYALVAVSRATHNTVYFTRQDDVEADPDAVATLIIRARRFTEQQLREYQIPAAKQLNLLDTLARTIANYDCVGTVGGYQIADTYTFTQTTHGKIVERLRVSGTPLCEANGNRLFIDGIGEDSQSRAASLLRERAQREGKQYSHRQRHDGVREIYIKLDRTDGGVQRAMSCIDELRAEGCTAGPEADMLHLPLAVFDKRDATSINMALLTKLGFRTTYHLGTSTSRVLPPQIVDFALNNGLADLPTEIFQSLPLPTLPIVDHPLITIETAVGVLQHELIKIYGVGMMKLTGKEQMLAERTNQQYDLTGISINIAKLHYVGTPKFDNMVPILDSGLSVPIDRTLDNYLCAIAKRNKSGYDNTSRCADHGTIAAVSVSAFRRAFVDEDRFLAICRHEYSPTVTDLDRWIANSDKAKIRLAKINGEVPVLYKDFTKYVLELKLNAKPDLTPSSLDNIPTPQTTVFTDTDITCLFAITLQGIAERIRLSMNSKTLLFTRINEVEVEDHINAAFPVSHLLRFPEAIEGDASVFDKSQRMTAMNIDLGIMRMFGAPDWFLQLWTVAHERTTIRVRDFGIGMGVDFQRKSGDAWTFLGNTLFNMSAYATVLDFKNVGYSMWGGDDNLLFARRGATEMLSASRFQRLFNLECKFFTKYSHPYFCGRFFIRDHTNWRIIYDPYKLLAKLGRKDLRNPHHVEEYRVAVMTLTRGYDDPRMWHPVTVALRERYGVRYVNNTLCAHLRGVVHPTIFHQLWRVPDSGNVNYGDKNKISQL